MLDADNPAENPDATPSAATDQQSGAADSTEGSSPATPPTSSTGGGEASDTQTGSPAETPPATQGEGASTEQAAPAKKAAAKRATKKTAVKKAAAKKTATRGSAKKTAEAPEAVAEAAPAAELQQPAPEGGEEKTAAPAVKKATAKRATKKAAAKRPSKKAAASAEAPAGPEGAAAPPAEAAEEQPLEESAGQGSAEPVSATALLFQAPDPTKAVVTRRRRATRPEAPAVSEPAGEASAEDREAEERPKQEKKGGKKAPKSRAEQPREGAVEETTEQTTSEEREEADGGEEEQGAERRRRRRGGRRRRRSGGGEEAGSAEGAEGGEEAEETPEQAAESAEGEETSGTGSRRRRRRRRSGEGEGNGDEVETTSRARKPRSAESEITAVTGSTRLEAKKQRRREGREAGRRRAPIVSEAEFLARRESVDRVMVIRQRNDLTQIAVLEDKVLVEHYVSRESQTSLIGNVYLGRVQNVLPSMEAAFIDIGKGRNAVLYAGEVNWDALGAKNGSPRRIEQVLKSGQTVLVQVTKDPIGHKGARLTSQVSLPGRFLVYVPDGTTSGISRKLPDTERNRLKNLLKDIVPDTAGVIVRTAAEGASEEELTRDVERLTARWADIEKKAGSGNAPQLLYGEPDLTLKVVRDLFTEDFNKLVISGGDAWDMVDGYVSHVAPDLADRLERYDGERDAFAAYRIDEQIEKALDRKVWLPSGGSLVIDRTEAMTVVDVNTGKFTGSGGNLEETVTKNNLEAAEEIVRQLRLRDIGGIIVVDFIDMVLESNRDLVLRRLVECLGRDRTRHQVAEVTSLGLVQMTRKRIGTGLLEAFSENCEHCGGRGLILHHEPVEPRKKSEEEPRRGRRGGRGRGREETAASGNGQQGGGVPSPKDFAAMAKHEEKPAEEAGAEESAEAKQGKPAEEESVAAGTPSEQSAAPSAGQSAGPAESPVAEPAPDETAKAAGPETTEASEAAAPAETKPAQPTKRNRRASRKAAPTDGHGPAQPAPAEEATVPAEAAVAVPTDETGQDGVATSKGVDEAAPEAVPAEPAATAAPAVVTTVRRRSARRAAGPPVSSPEASPAASTAVSAQGNGATASNDESTEEPSDVDTLATLVDAAEEPSDVHGVETEGPDDDPHSTPHVPVKKRGSRRR